MNQGVSTYTGCAVTLTAFCNRERGLQQGCKAVYDLHLVILYNCFLSIHFEKKAITFFMQGLAFRSHIHNTHTRFQVKWCGLYWNDAREEMLTVGEILPW